MPTETNRVLRRAVRLALLSGGAFATGVAGHSSVAQAQEAPAAKSAVIEEVVVTGSRIATPNLDAISPVTAVTGAEIKDQGVSRVEDLLNSLPQVVADQGSGISMGTNGIATVNLRGLGQQRTLVLINGRRVMGGDPGANLGANPSFASAADLNQIPVALIERVDVLTGGASSTYGADAVGGVVNFVMNDHFEGVRVDVNGSIANHSNHKAWIDSLLVKRGFAPVTGSNWDANSKDMTMILGHNFAEGAGNLEAYAGYRRASPATADRRDFATCVLSNGGPASGSGVAGPYSCFGSSNSAPALFFSNADGSALQISPTGDVVGRYQRFNYAASHYLQRQDERYTAGLFGKLKFNDHAEAYTEFTFMDDNTRGNYAPAGAFLGSRSPAIDASSGQPDGNLTVNCGAQIGGNAAPYGNPGMNPFLTQNFYNAVCNFPAYNFNPAGTPGPAYQILPNGDAQLTLGRRNIEGGPRQENYNHTEYRGILGARGELARDWNYDVYGLFGNNRSSDFHNNDTSTVRIQNALLAVRDPVTGNIVCRGGEPGCIPWNIWNPASPVSAANALAYISVPGEFNASEDENVVSGYVSGDLTKSGIKTPWADDGLKVVFGSEFRREALATRPDGEFQAADLAGIGSPVPPVNASFHVWEAFTEERLPLVRNAPFAKTLDFETGYRYSSYSLGFSTNTYKFGLEWAPVSDVRLRGSYNRAVRAPNIQELYQPTHVGLDTGTDVCAPGTSFTVAQCALTGLSPAQYGSGVLTSPAAQYNGQVGGNANLKPEVGKTTNVGLVITPSFLPGFSSTIDYTDIKITNLINSYGPNVIQQNCITTGLSLWCGLIHRNAAGSLWSSEQGYTIDGLLNEGGLENKGLDLGLAYRVDLGRAGRLRSRFDGGYLLKLLFTPAAASSFDCRGKFGPDCVPATPKWRHRLALDWDTPVSGLSAGLTWRYFGSTSNTLIDPSVPPDYLGPGFVVNGPPLDARLPAISYLDLRASYTWNKVTIRAGIDNVLDKDPPLFDTQNSGGNSIYAESNTFSGMYDVLGRVLFLNFTVDF
jgi:iron complex outermembrane receptor protein